MTTIPEDQAWALWWRHVEDANEWIIPMARDRAESWFRPDGTKIVCRIVPAGEWDALQAELAELRATNERLNWIIGPPRTLDEMRADRETIRSLRDLAERATGPYRTPPDAPLEEPA